MEALSDHYVADQQEDQRIPHFNGIHNGKDVFQKNPELKDVVNIFEKKLNLAHAKLKKDMAETYLEEVTTEAALELLRKEDKFSTTGAETNDEDQPLESLEPENEEERAEREEEEIKLQEIADKRQSQIYGKMLEAYQQQPLTINDIPDAENYLNSETEIDDLSEEDIQAIRSKLPKEKRMFNPQKVAVFGNAKIPYTIWPDSSADVQKLEDFILDGAGDVKSETQTQSKQKGETTVDRTSGAKQTTDIEELQTQLNQLRNEVQLHKSTLEKLLASTA